MNTNFNKKLGNRIKEFRINFDYSQEELANILKISRVALSQIECGERKLNAQELANLSKAFNTTCDKLLDLERDIEVIIKKAEKKNKRKEEMRISVPQKNIKKFREVLLYILKKVGSKPNVGESVIYKLLYFIDFDFYELYEEQLIGASYQKNHYGPTPVEFKKIVDEMEHNEEIFKIPDKKYFQYPQRKYLPLREPDLSKLKAHELKIIDEVISKLSDMNASQIRDYSHKDVPWLTTEEGKIIDYESVFYRTPPYSVRSYNEEHI